MKASLQATGPRRGGFALAVAIGVFAAAAQAAPVALRSYATEWNREAQAMPVAQKEALVEGLLNRWEPAALRLGADRKTWRDTFGLQLSLLPGSTLMAVAQLSPDNGFQGIVDKVAATLRGFAEKVATKDVGETTTDLVFVPINPCRIVDTRFGGGGFLNTGSPRNFVYANPVSGTFASQGGSGTNCGLVFAGSLTPLSPKAVAATVTVVNATGSGNFVIYPTGSTPGSTSALNYTAGAVLANSTVIVGAQGGAADFTVALNGPAHGADVIVDVIGYYYAPAATALDCVTVASPAGASTTGDVVAGAGAAFTATCPTVPAGYVLTGGGCAFFTTAQQPPTTADTKVLINRSQRVFDNVSQTFTNQWVCQWANNDTITWRVQTRAVCCRIPGH